MRVPGPNLHRPSGGKRVVILRRHHPADDDEDVGPTVLIQRRAQGGHQGEVPGGEA